MVKIQRQYYLCNIKSAYLPVNRRLHREREQERMRETERERKREKDRKRERGVKW